MLSIFPSEQIYSKVCAFIKVQTVFFRILSTCLSLFACR